MKRYNAELFWEGHGHNDRDHTIKLESNDIEELKIMIAEKTLSGIGYEFVRAWGADLLDIKDDVDKIRERLRHEQAMLEQKANAEAKKKKEEENIKAAKRREENQRKLYEKLKAKFEKEDKQ